MDVARGAAVLTILSRPATEKGRSKAPVRLFVDTPSGPRAPDFFLDNPARVFAAWYDLEPSAATLRVESDDLTIGSHPLKLMTGKVTTVRLPMTFRKPIAKKGGIK